MQFDESEMQRAIEKSNNDPDAQFTRDWECTMEKSKQFQSKRDKQEKAVEAAEIDEAIKAVEAAEAAEKIKTGKNRNFAGLPLCTLLFLLAAIYYSNCVGHTLGQLLLKVDSFGHCLLIGRRK